LNQSNLIRVLLEGNLIVPDMLVEGKVYSTSLGQSVHLVTKELLITSITADAFLCRDRLGLRHMMQFTNVDRIDGMDLDRFAAVYNIKSDGSLRNTGKKRGRKPKSAQINTLEGDSNGKDKRTEGHTKAQQALA